MTAGLTLKEVSRIIVNEITTNEKIRVHGPQTHYRCKATYSLYPQLVVSPITYESVNDACESVSVFRMHHSAIGQEHPRFFFEVMAKENRKGQLMIKIVFINKIDPTQGSTTLWERWSMSTEPAELVSFLKQRHPAVVAIVAHVDLQPTGNCSHKPNKNGSYISLLQNVPPTLEEQTPNGVAYTLSADSFCEVNPFMEIKMFQYISRTLLLFDTERNPQLFSLFLSGRDVLAMQKSLASQYGFIESVTSCPSVFEDAAVNQVDCKLSQKNSIWTCLNQFVEKRETSTRHVIITAGRHGLHPSTTVALVNLANKRLVHNFIYISCNKESFARDFHILKEGLRLIDVSVFDFFPGTSYAMTVIHMMPYKFERLQGSLLVLPIGPPGSGKTTAGRWLHEIFNSTKTSPTAQLMECGMYCLPSDITDDPSIPRKCLDVESVMQVRTVERDRLFKYFRDQKMSLKSARAKTHEALLGSVCHDAVRSLLYLDSTNGSAEARQLYLSKWISEGNVGTSNHHMIGERECVVELLFLCRDTDLLLKRLQQRTDHPSFPTNPDEQREKLQKILSAVDVMGTRKHITNDLCVTNAQGEKLRCTVQCMILNAQGQFLVGTMCGKCNERFRNPVQGGIINGETLLDCAQRELMEEMGIDINDLEFISVILPKAVMPDSFPIQETDAITVLELMRTPFQYRTRSYIECVGQCVFPILFVLKNPNIRVNFQVEKQSNGFQTFNKAFWDDLSVLFQRAPPKKKSVMEAICAATEVYKRLYWASLSLSIPPTVPRPSVIPQYKLQDNRKNEPSSILGDPVAVNEVTNSFTIVTDQHRSCDEGSVLGVPTYPYSSASILGPGYQESERMIIYGRQNVQKPLLFSCSNDLPGFQPHDQALTSSPLHFYYSSLSCLKTKLKSFSHIAGLELHASISNYFTSLWNKPETRDDKIKDYIPEVVEESLLEERAVQLENTSRDTIVELGNKILVEIEKKSPTSRMAPYFNQLLKEYGVKDIIFQRPLSYLIYPTSSVLSSSAETSHELVLSFSENFRELIEEVERSGCSARKAVEVGSDSSTALKEGDEASQGSTPECSTSDVAAGENIHMTPLNDYEPLDITLYVKVAAGMALANINCGDFAHAVKCVDAALLHAKDSQRIGGLYGMKAGILVRMKKYSDAEEAALKAIDHSQNVQGYLHGSYALYQQGRIVEAVNLLEAAREFHPMDVSVASRLSEIKKRLPEAPLQLAEESVPTLSEGTTTHPADKESLH
eukprot:gene5320-3822_t